MRAAYAYVLTVAIAVACAFPILRDPPRDSFPLSNYPMFSYGRPSPAMEISHVLGVHRGGQRKALPSSVVMSIEVLQTMVAIQQAIDRGPEATRRFCEEVAGRVVESGDEELAEVTELEVATSHFDSVAYAAGQHTPTARHVHVRCDVRRP